MADDNIKLRMPAAAAIARELYAMLRAGADVRELQGANASRAQFPLGGTITNAAITTIPEALSGNGQQFFQMLMVFDPTSGPVNFRIDGDLPTVTLGTGGFATPGGWSQIVITGNDNIKNFRAIAQSATAAPFFRVLFV